MDTQRDPRQPEREFAIGDRVVVRFDERGGFSVSGVIVRPHPVMTELFLVRYDTPLWSGTQMIDEAMEPAAFMTKEPT